MNPLLLPLGVLGIAALRKSPSGFAWSVAGTLLPFPWSIPLTVLGAVWSYRDAKDTLKKVIGPKPGVPQTGGRPT